MKSINHALATACVAIGLICTHETLLGQTSTNQSDYFKQLAKRFRPYLKYSQEACGEEPHHPCSSHHILRAIGA